MIVESIAKLVERVDLSREEARQSMKEIMGGEATVAQVAGFITALRMKGETIDEITACAEVMREFATRISPKVGSTLVDTCGTGGDKIKTFNVSTAAMFVAAGAGVPVAKHGNRSVTSKCGSADVLEALGVKLDTEPKHVEKMIETLGLGFMFAPKYHGAMKHAIGPRRELKIRTVFNVLGPLTNPANAKAQLLGVFNPGLTETMASVLKNLGSEKALVVHGQGGLDEISSFSDTSATLLSDGDIKNITLSPEKLGVKKATPQQVSAGATADENAKILVEVLKNTPGPRLDIVLLNAGAAIFLGGKADEIKEGVQVAKETVSSGKALEKLKKMVAESGGDEKKLGELL